MVAVTAAISQGKWNTFEADPHPLKLFQDIDQASRGGIGSLRAIFNSNIGLTTTFGAFITVTSLLFQPMIQATINNNSGPVSKDTLQASVGSNRYLDGGSFDIMRDVRVQADGNGYHDIFDVHTDIGLQIAITGGFSTSPKFNTVMQLAWNCPTGDCTWPIYASLAVCSKCFDVSELLTSRNINGLMPLPHENIPSNMADPIDLSTNMTQYTLEYANLTLKNPNTYQAVSPEYLGSFVTEYMVAKSEKLPGRTAHFQDYESLLISFSMIKADTSYVSNLSMWQEISPAAMECGLFLCLQAYNTTVQSGRLVETIVASTRRKTPQSWQNTEYQSLKKANLTALGTLDWNPINNNGFLNRTDFQLDASALAVPISSANETFNATQTLLCSMVEYLDGLLETEDNSTLNVDDAMAYDDKLYGIQKYTTPTIQNLFQSSDLNETFISVASSVTSYFRNTGNSPQVKRWTIHYKISWPFIALPVFVVFGGAVLLVISIYQTYKQNMAVWKDNIIATMVYSVDSDTRSQLRQKLLVQKLGDVGDLIVYMHEHEDGVELSTTPNPDGIDDETVNRPSMSSFRRVSNVDSLVPSVSQTESAEQVFTSSQALVPPISTRTLIDTPP
ncbi:hypothetical protein KCU65_g9178, partial [Aureobasidium melanogenum]